MNFHCVLTPDKYPQEAEALDILQTSRAGDTIDLFGQYYRVQAVETTDRVVSVYTLVALITGIISTYTLTHHGDHHELAIKDI